MDLWATSATVKKARHRRMQTPTQIAPIQNNRPRPKRRWIWPRVFVYSFLLGFILLNLLAYFHGRTMSRYASKSPRTRPPEELTLLTRAKVLLMGVEWPRPENRQTPEDYGLPYDTVHFPGAFGVELQAWQIERSDGLGTIVMFHGHGAAKESLLPAAETFYKLGWNCALVDFHGSGGSGTNITSVGWHEAEDVVAAVPHLAPNYVEGPVILYGVSMGSAAILRALYISNLTPDAVILELPYDRLINAARTRFSAMRVPSWPAADLLLFYGGMHGGFDAFAMNPAEFAVSVNCPSLVMNGEIDRRATPKQTLAVFGNLAGPKIHKQFRGLGHRNFSRHDPENWKATVSSFLNAVRDGSLMDEEQVDRNQ